MKKIGMEAIFLGVGAACLFGFQNFSMVNLDASRIEGASVASISSPDAQTVLESAQTEMSSIMGEPTSSPSEIQTSIRSLKDVLQELQAMNTSNLPKDVRDRQETLLQQITTDIFDLQDLLSASLSQGSKAYSRSR
jgi:hypothetical protein